MSYGDAHFGVDEKQLSNGMQPYENNLIGWFIYTIGYLDGAPDKDRAEKTGEDRYRPESVLLTQQTGADYKTDLVASDGEFGVILEFKRGRKEVAEIEGPEGDRREVWRRLEAANFSGSKRVLEIGRHCHWLLWNAGDPGPDLMAQRFLLAEEESAEAPWPAKDFALALKRERQIVGSPQKDFDIYAHALAELKYTDSGSGRWCAVVRMDASGKLRVATYGSGLKRSQEITNTRSGRSRGGISL